MDKLENFLPAPSISPQAFATYTQEEKEAIVNEAGEYQKLADILAEHPVVQFIINETKMMDSVRA